MAFASQTFPCFVCDSDQKKASGAGKDERLTQCLGSAYVEKVYEEGIITHELGGSALAEFIVNPRERRAASGCNASGSERLFHQSCLGRKEGAGLSYSTHYYSWKNSRDGKYPELRCTGHLLCDDCLAAVRLKCPGEHRLKRLTHENITGTDQIVSLRNKLTCCPNCTHGWHVGNSQEQM